MEIRKSFEVRASPDAVWEFLIDPHRVAACLPGARITDKVDDSYHGTITVKVGPVTSSYKGKMKFARLDAGAREAEIDAVGQDVRGKGGAELSMKSRVVPRDGGVTEVIVTTEAKVTGLLAQLGRGMIVEVSDQLIDKFAVAMQAQLETSTAGPAQTPPEASQAGSIDVLALGAKALVRRPAVWVAAAILAAVLIWLLSS